MAPHVKDESVEMIQNNIIPIIDLAGIDGPEGQSISQRIVEACETWGFFYLINHGVDQSLMKQVKDVSTAFFYGPEEEKMRIKVQPGKHVGWNHPQHMIDGNNLIQKDTVEHLTVAWYPRQQAHLDRAPQQPASYRSTLLEYTKEVKYLGEKLLGTLSENLGLAPDAIQGALTSCSASKSLRVVVRTNFYPLNKDGEALPDACHAHTDPGALIFLLADDVPGLEVRKDGQWVKVDPIPGAFITNVGDMLEVCSNGRYKSLEHKGMPSQKQERLTIATFLGPEEDAVVGPIKSLLNESHPPLYKTSTFEAYMGEFVKHGLNGKTRLERHRI